MKDELIDIATELGETTLDAVIQEGWVRDIPVVGPLVNAAKAYQSLRDRIFLKRIARFVTGFEKLTEVEKESFRQEIASLQDNPKEATRLGDAVALALDNTNNMHKAEIHFRLLAAYVNRRLKIKAEAGLEALLMSELEAFETLSEVVNAVMYRDLIEFPKWIFRTHPTEQPRTIF